MNRPVILSCASRPVTSEVDGEAVQFEWHFDHFSNSIKAINFKIFFKVRNNGKATSFFKKKEELGCFSGEFFSTVQVDCYTFSSKSTEWNNTSCIRHLERQLFPRVQLWWGWKMTWAQVPLPTAGELYKQRKNVHLSEERCHFSVRFLWVDSWSSKERPRDLSDIYYSPHWNSTQSTMLKYESISCNMSAGPFNVTPSKWILELFSLCAQLHPRTSMVVL